MHCETTTGTLNAGAVKDLATLSPGEAPGQARQAVFQAGDGRPGPALLDLPSDLGRAECDGPSYQSPGNPPPRLTQIGG